jgi:putative membrane protein insertion efficiency factor
VKYLSLLIRAFVPNPGVAGLPVCKYYPTCSEYSSLAYREFGPIRGTWLTVWRLLRCNPWSRGGVDYPGELRPGNAAGKAAVARAKTPSRLRRLVGPRA